MAQLSKGGKRFIKATGAVVLAAIAMLGAGVLVAKNKSDRISDVSQVETIAEALNCDLSYMKLNPDKEIIRMMHNDDEPIYVHITDEMNEEEHSLINQSLDYVFDIVGSINDNYDYKLVNQKEYSKQKSLGKTTIKYIEGDCVSSGVDASGQIARGANIIEKFSSNDYYTHYVIEYDREDSKDQDEEGKLYTFIHELLHAFGLDDVYVSGPNKCTDIDFYNTYMKGYAIDNMISPNDFKCLVSAYAAPMNAEKLDDYISSKKEVVQRYEDFYYKNAVQRLINYENNNVSSLQGRDVYSKFESTLTHSNGTEVRQQATLKIVDDNYILEFTGGGRETQSIATGKVIEIDGVKVLQNVQFSGTFELSEKTNANQTVMDLYVIRCNNRDMLYNAINFGSMWGKNLEQEQEIEK